jgi:hypothetical protein
MLILNGDELTDDDLFLIDYYKYCGIPPASYYKTQKDYKQMVKMEKLGGVKKETRTPRLGEVYGRIGGNEMFSSLYPENLL